MSNISKFNLKGVEYNLTDKDAQSKIAELKANSATKAELQNASEEVASVLQEVDNLKENTYTKAQCDSKFAKKSEIPDGYDDSELRDRIEELEAKEDKDTVYDDSLIRHRLDILENIDHSKYLTQHQDISGKVDKVSGKGLSTNDYTTAEKNKLAATPLFWVGSQAEYDALSTKDNNTFYYITEE